MGDRIKTPEAFNVFVKEVEGRSGYRQPMAFGIGIAYLSESGNMLDTFFPVPNFKQNHGTAAVFSDVTRHLSGTGMYRINEMQVQKIMDRFMCFCDDGKRHDNIDAVKNLYEMSLSSKDTKALVVAFIDQPEYDEGPRTVPDAYLRLHLLSHRLVRPNEINLEGIFGVLPNNAWTNEGPIALEDLPMRRMKADPRRPIHINAVDKFPRMVDYVVPSGVRIADASRIRLGAYLGEGTTVMHEGFCNFNAGTVGASMIEGRISAGVVIGSKTDVGGGASIMGTLSGGGKEKIVIGRGCLLGANSGTGISLGDKCVIEAGLYVTAGMVVSYKGTTMKAKELSRKDGITFRRNSTTGEVEALDRPNPVELNEELHKN